jgi:hypothetical protein
VVRCGAKAKKATEAKEAKAKEAAGVGRCGHPWLPTYHDGGVIQQIIRMVMTGGWFMILGLSHITLII